MGADWYCRASGEAVFEVPKPNLKKGIGFDALPTEVLHSPVLTGNDLGRLANAEALPTPTEVAHFRQTHTSWAEIQQKTTTTQEQLYRKHAQAKQLLAQNQLKEAWLWLLA
jgi:hypothetical protein